MIPFNYDFKTKESKNLLENIKYIYIPWKNIPKEFVEDVTVDTSTQFIRLVLPTSFLSDVTIFKFTLTNKADIFVCMRAKIKGFTNFPENFDNCKVEGDVLVMCGPRF